MKNGLGGSLSQIAAAAMEMTILIRRIMNVPISAFRALSKMLESAKERDIAVLSQTMSRMMIGPGLMDTISKRNATAIRRKMIIDNAAERAKSR